MREFDVVVIGAGPAGEVAAGRLAEAGLSVAIVEKHLVAGECSFYACMPSKALLRPGEALREVGRIPGAAEAVTGELDVKAMLERRDDVIHDLDDSSQIPWLEERGIELFRATGRFEGERRVRAGDEVLEAKRAVIVSTGSGAAVPGAIEGLREAEPWTNREATTTHDIPESLIILGGGVVGCEMAQAYSDMGCKVTLIEGESRLLAREEEFACEQVTESLAGMGVEIRTGRKVASVKRLDGTRVEATLDDGSTAEGAQVLSALGRFPHTKELDLESAGVEADEKGYLTVDDDMRVNDWLYAIGDVNGRALFTHMGKYQAHLATEHILGRSAAAEHGADRDRSPRVVFTEPQVAAVGLTSKQAEEEGLKVRCIDITTSGNAGGSFSGRNAPGTARFVVDTEREVLVGVTITGAEVADFLHAATIAIVGEVPMRRLRHAVPSFPTRSEIWLRALDAWDEGNEA